PPCAHPLSFFLTPPATTETYTLSLHDALPICTAPPSSRYQPGARSTVSSDTQLPPRATPVTPLRRMPSPPVPPAGTRRPRDRRRSEEHTSELQSRENLVCRLLLEKKKKKTTRR